MGSEVFKCTLRNRGVLRFVVRFVCAGGVWHRGGVKTRRGSVLVWRLEGGSYKQSVIYGCQTGLHLCPEKLYLGHGVAGLSKSHENFDFLMVVKNIYRRQSFGLQSLTNGQKICIEPVLYSLHHPKNTVLDTGEGKMKYRSADSFLCKVHEITA